MVTVGQCLERCPRARRYVVAPKDSPVNGTRSSCWQRRLSWMQKDSPVNGTSAPVSRLTSDS